MTNQEVEAQLEYIGRNSESVSWHLFMRVVAWALLVLIRRA